MGLFSHRRSTSSSTQETPPKEKTDEEKAFDYFDTEEIRCDSETDRDTITFIYKSLKVKNGDTSDASDMKEGLRTLDNNVYHFARAVFYQNFMLMRKIDALSDRIRALEEKANQKSFTLNPPVASAPPRTRLTPLKGR